MKDFIKLMLIVILVSLAIYVIFCGIMIWGFWINRYEIIEYAAECDNMRPVPGEVLHPCGCSYQTGRILVLQMFSDIDPKLGSMR